MTTTHTLRDPDNRDDDGSPFEVTGDAERIAIYLDMLAERDMRTLSGRQAVQDLAARVRYEGTVTPEVAEDIRLAAGVYVTAIVPADDRTVQVPVSLIKDADRYIEGLGLKPTSAQANWARAGYLAGRAHSLSQPTPTPTSDPDFPAMHDEQGRARFGCSLVPSAPAEPTREQIADRLRGDIFDAVPDDNDMQHVLSLAADLLSQPNPTAEPKRVLLTHPHDGHGPDDTCRDCQAAETPRPEDMAPGTTFTAVPLRSDDGFTPRRWMITRAGWSAASDHNDHLQLVDIDPSTIRDVTAPKGDDRG